MSSHHSYNTASASPDETSEANTMSPFHSRLSLRNRNASSTSSSYSPPSSSSMSAGLDQNAFAGAPTAVSTSMRGMRRLEARRGLEESHYLASKARSAHLNAPVDMHMLEYVSNYDTNLMCPICRCPLVDPVILYDCDHCFCRDCLRQTWTEYTPAGPRGNCPTCRASTKLMGRGGVSKILVNILDELVVRCPKHEEGCKAEVKRGAIADHVNLYCEYAMVDCPSQTCELPLRRKDAKECLHYGVSCLDCHATMLLANLETHWEKECPDRKALCQLCQSSVNHRELQDHVDQTCPATSIPCTGAEFGCTVRSKRGEIEKHTKTCTLATLAPFLEAQKKRQDEQEQSQKLLARKVQILEGGFESLQKILYAQDPDLSAAEPSRIPLLEAQLHTGNNSTATADTDSSSDTLHFPAPPSNRNSGLSTNPTFPSFSPSDAFAIAASPPPQDFSFTPPPLQSSPFTSPLHHLLSMHEALRDEVARIAAALTDLDGRHSMLILNENLRLKEEMAYLGAQVSGVMRQVGWLTSARLQAQVQHSPHAAAQTAGGGESSQGSGGGGGGDGGGSVGVQGAVNTAATALRGAARVVNVGREGMGLGRRATDEGRTKL